MESKVVAWKAGTKKHLKMISIQEQRQVQCKDCDYCGKSPHGDHICTLRWIMYANPGFGRVPVYVGSRPETSELIYSFKTLPDIYKFTCYFGCKIVNPSDKCGHPNVDVTFTELPRNNAKRR